MSAALADAAPRIVSDGDTIQVGYGSVPNAILSALARKKHLGVHTELLTDGIACTWSARPSMRAGICGCGSNK